MGDISSLAIKIIRTKNSPEKKLSVSCQNSRGPCFVARKILSLLKVLMKKYFLTIENRSTGSSGSLK
jgi:hypothetical protein